MNNVKDPRKAQELAVQMLPLADAWQADIIAPVCTNDDFKALLVALGKAITCTDASLRERPALQMTVRRGWTRFWNVVPTGNT